MDNENTNLNKYFKYKRKYLELKNMKGGGKVFDLVKNYPEYIKGDLQNNLKKLIKKYGNKIKMKYNDEIIEIDIVEETLPNKTKFYSMYYDIENRSERLYPLKISFINITNYKKDNISYISNISKTGKISGSNMVKISLAINRILGANKTYLNDGATIDCGNEKMDLSYLKLIENGLTFYMKLGFKFEILDSSPYYYYKLDSEKALIKEINKYILNIKKIKIKDLIKEYNETLDLINKIIKSNDKLEIFLYDEDNTFKDNIWKRVSSSNDIISLFDECYIMLNLLNNSLGTEYLYELMIKLFKEDCEKYLLINKYLIENTRIEIRHNKKIISRNYIKDFKILKEYRYQYNFYYKF